MKLTVNGYEVTVKARRKDDPRCNPEATDLFMNFVATAFLYASEHFDEYDNERDARRFGTASHEIKEALEKAGAYGCF